MRILGIESTCDETACAIVEDGKRILSNVIASQAAIHEVYGGVVPELACRRHIDVILPVIDQALTQAGLQLAEIDAIAVAYGPGLVGALLIGLNVAKALALTLGKPLIPVNHVEAHLYGAIMSTNAPIAFPALGLIISGGHTALLSMQDVDSFSLLGQTVDDAIGEAFDKVAKMLHLPYPGGPHIEKLARAGNAERFSFKGGTVKGRPLYFSFSGLKTSVLYTLQGQNCTKGHATLSHQDQCDIAASFQKAAFDDLIKKSKRALESFPVQDMFFGGGVSNNRALRNCFQATFPQMALHWPAENLSLDNAAMLAGLGYYNYQRKGPCDFLSLEAMTRIPFSIAENEMGSVEFRPMEGIARRDCQGT